MTFCWLQYQGDEAFGTGWEMCPRRFSLYPWYFSHSTNCHLKKSDHAEDLDPYQRDWVSFPYDTYLIHSCPILAVLQAPLAQLQRGNLSPPASTQLHYQSHPLSQCWWVKSDYAEAELCWEEQRQKKNSPAWLVSDVTVQRLITKLLPTGKTKIPRVSDTLKCLEVYVRSYTPHKAVLCRC